MYVVALIPSTGTEDSRGLGEAGDWVDVVFALDEMGAAAERQGKREDALFGSGARRRRRVARLSSVAFSHVACILRPPKAVSVNEHLAP